MPNASASARVMALEQMKEQVARTERGQKQKKNRWTEHHTHTKDGVVPRSGPLYVFFHMGCAEATALWPMRRNTLSSVDWATAYSFNSGTTSLATTAAGMTPI